MIIVCFASEPWHGLWQRHQHIMSRMNDRGHKIIYVDPTTTLNALNKPKLFTQRTEVLDSGIIIVRPLFLPLHYRLGGLERYDAIKTSRLINKALKKLGSQKPDIIWLSSPFFGFIKDFYADTLVIFDNVDACDGFFSTELTRQWILKKEEELLERADAVFAVSKGLLESSARLNHNSYLVPNGASSLSAGSDVPIDLKMLTRPRIGYVGRMSYWVDFKLLLELATVKPSYSIVLIGPVDSKDHHIRKLRQMENVHFLGTKEFKTVPSYIKGLDVCTIPFKIQTLTNMANPVKLFEYASMGKPIVSTPLDGVREFSDLAYISDGTSEGFIEKIDAAIMEEGDDLPRRRQAMAREYDWESITGKVEKILLETSKIRH